MNSLFKPVLGTGKIYFCQTLRRTLSGLTDTALAILDRSRPGIVVGTKPDPFHRDPYATSAGPPLLRPDMMRGMVACVLSSEHLTQLELYAGQPDSGEDGQGNRRWRGYMATFENGITDIVALLQRPDAEDRTALGFLSTIWPILREDVVRDISIPATNAGDDAMLWMISNKIDLAVMVMNAKGQMLRANAAARTMLESAQVLIPGKGGIRGVCDLQTRMFRDAIAACAAEISPAIDPNHHDCVLFLDTATPGLRVPVTLMRYTHAGQSTGLVTVMLPTPPARDRVEMLARKMGLTHAEARVAALLQMGHSNKVAAQMAGLKEQSFATYSKRVLSKLNVTSRAEIAQLLTWQAQGGRLS